MLRPSRALRGARRRLRSRPRARQGSSVMSSASSLLDLLTPDPGRVPWNELQVFDWVRALEACPQDPIHHAEGNVWIHTRMVLETLLTMPGYQALDEADRRVVHIACLMHDIAKPATTRTGEGGWITANGNYMV